MLAHPRVQCKPELLKAIKLDFHVFLDYRAGEVNLNTVKVSDRTIHRVTVKKKTTKQAELIRKHSGWCLLRPERADQSELTGLFRKGALKRQALKLSAQAEGNRDASALDIMLKVMFSCKH